jgi:phage terminase large subunit GpA-like protein
MGKFDLIESFLEGLRPIPIMTVSEWAQAQRMLSALGSAEHGPWRNERTPYLREIMDKLSARNPAQKVVFVKSAQVGGTEAANNWIGYIIDNAPAPTLMVMPTEDTMKRNSKTRIDPMIEATPRLRKKIAPANTRNSGNTTLQKDFPGGVLIMTGANAASGLRSMPICNLFMDEVDAYPLDLDGEGSPIDLAIARTKTFGARKKILLVSTPTLEGTSVIWREFEATDQRKYHVPCPHCGHKQHLVFEQLKWAEGKPETAQYACEDCGGLIDEYFKSQMLSGGEWRSTCPENDSPILVGYHINSLYSPYGWQSWADIVREFESALKDPLKMKTFTNINLGICWRESGEVPEWERIFDRRETYKQGVVPSGAAFLTAGVDVQADRLELEIVGWGANKESWSVDYRVLPGDTSARDVWDNLAKVVTETWEREDGLLMPLALMAVDTGYNTQHVYDFCRRFDRTRVIPVKGMNSLNVPISTPSTVDVAPAGKKIGSLQIWPVGVGLLKSELYGFLKQGINPETGEIPYGYCHFPQYAPDYFRGLTAEKLQYTDKKGVRKYEWVKHFTRNEPLDCRVYARAAAEVIGISRLRTEDYQAMTAAYSRRVAEPEPAKRKGRQSDFW